MLQSGIYPKQSINLFKTINGIYQNLTDKNIGAVFTFIGILIHHQYLVPFFQQRFTKMVANAASADDNYIHFCSVTYFIQLVVYLSAIEQRQLWD